jgi:hypothetical protein
VDPVVGSFPLNVGGRRARSRKRFPKGRGEASGRPTIGPARKRQDIERRVEESGPESGFHPPPERASGRHAQRRTSAVESKNLGYREHVEGGAATLGSCPMLLGRMQFT